MAARAPCIETVATSRRASTVMLVVGLLLATYPAVAHGAEKQELAKCTRHSGQGSAGPKLSPTVKLVPDVPAEIINFGGSDAHEFVDVVLTATPALPHTVRADQISLGVLRRFTRASQTLRRETAPTPTFTEPQISPNRDRVTFTVCLSGSGLKAGSYGGSVYIEGPTGLSPASVSITENAKNRGLAIVGAIVALVAAFIFLWLRGAAARQVAAEQEQAAQLADAAKANDPARIASIKAAPPKSVRRYLGGVFQDLNWVITTLVALGAALGTIIGIYNANPAWGADLLGSLVGLVGPTFTAVGVQSVVASLGRSVTKS